MPLESNALISFTQRLIRARSITAGEQEVVGVLSTEMEQLGFDRVLVDEFGSIIGIIEGTQPGPTILLDGHCDTVDAQASDWKHEPWAGEIENGRLYGRGAADMKGSLAAMVHAAGMIDRNNLRGRVAVSATVSEEFAEGGALQNVVNMLHPDYVVIGEATQLNLNRGGRGRAEIQLTTHGRSAHSSSPEAGRCAVTDMLRIIQAISDRPVSQDPFLGPGSIVLTDIISEPYPGHSVIPYRCNVTYDRRLLPGESESGLLNELRSLQGTEDIEHSAVLAGLEEHTYTGSLLHGKKFFPAWLFPETHPYVQSALRGLQSTGLNPRIGAYRFCTNATYCAGVAGIPTVGFGIGREEDAHTVDESISIADLMIAAKGYQGMIHSVCQS
ncbi:MAG: YgeY family selenium metabolism-linked hydrolase [Spirochaetota bacterium]